MKVSQAIELYRVVAATQKAHSWKTWLKIIGSEVGDREISSITTGDVNAFIARRRASGHANATIKSQINTFRQLFYTAKDHGVQCAWPERVAKVVVNNDRCVFFQGNEESRLRAAMSKADFRIVELGFSTGLRGFEMWLLEKRDIDLAQGFIHVRDGKGGFSRRVPIGKTARKALVEMMANKVNKYVVNPPGYEHYEKRNRCMAAWKERVFRPACRAAGIDAHFHDLTRHEFATRVVRQGKSLYVVQRALGHANPVMTQRYSHLSDRDLKDAVASI